MAQPKVELMDLPTELIERILEFALVSDEPIELAPLAFETPPDRECVGFEKHNPRASFYADSIRPDLSLLRTCRTFHDLGARAFYSLNEFRFSNSRGHYILACFLYLIGPANVNRLGNVTITCPSLVVHYRASGVDRNRMYEDVLAPAGMTSRADFENAFRPRHFNNRTYAVFEAIAPTLDVLRQIRNLRSLSFLFYQTSYTAVPHWLNGQSAMQEKLDHLHNATQVADWMDGKGFTRVKRKFVHLFSDADTSIEVTKMSDVKWRPEWPGVSESDFRDHCEKIKQAGFEIVDMTFAEYDPASVDEFREYVKEQEAEALTES